MIQRFMQYYKPHISLFILDFSCATGLAALELVFPSAVRKVVDEVIPSGNMELLMWAGAGLLVLYVAAYFMQFAVDYWGHVVGTRMEYDMRKELFQHVQKLSFTYFDNTKTGHIMSRMVNDLNEISEMAHHGPEDLFLTAVTLTGSFILMAGINWQLTLIIFSLIPFMAWFAVVKNRDMRKTFRDYRLKVADINAQVEDSISGVRVVKSFANEVYEGEKFEESNWSYRQTREKAMKIMGQFYAGLGFFGNCVQLTVLVAGGIFVYHGWFTIGGLMSFFLYTALFIQPIKRLGILMETYQKGMAGFSRFLEIMDEHPDITDAPNAGNLSGVVGEIKLEKVTFSYNEKANVLRDISLTIAPGETVALVGPSGSGKSTLCSLIPRFYEVDEGSIRIDGKDIRQVTQKTLRENIGVVQQDVFLFSATVRENIAYGQVDGTDAAIEEAARLADAHDFIMSLPEGYDTYIGERGVKLSGGQKQRLAIARMFLKNPPILILDEATSALDNETEKIIQESLAKLSVNRTTLVIAHRLATIQRADRIIVLTDEGIMEEGKHGDLLEQNGLYARLYRAQFQGFLPDSA